MPVKQKTCDVLIVGGGVAGLSLALQLPERVSVYLLSKREYTHSSSYLAQGGISAAVGRGDSIASHVEDTLQSGAGLCDADVVREVAEAAPAAVHWLQEIGVQFSIDQRQNKAVLQLAHEGGHSRRRIVHSRDRTGRAIVETMRAQIKKRANVQQIEDRTAIDLMVRRDKDQLARCLGLYALNTKTQQVVTYTAKAVVLATGGSGKVYLYTSNPEGASGDGVAMAWRAGCRVANMEFIQFHPTCLYHPQARSVLLSETLRGEGAKLLRADGSRFMPAYDSRGELAPRDVVARAIDFEMKKTGVDCVYLDISGRPADFYRQRFPSIYQQCLQYGYDLAKSPAPVVPAVHYNCGGVVTDLSGRTDINRLYVIGESACTGLHGANRIASNSLLECVVQAQRASVHVCRSIARLSPIGDVADWDDTRVSVAAEKITIAHNWDALRRLMWNYVGVARAGKRLHRAKKHIHALFEEVQNYYASHRISGDLIELRNLIVVANLIVCSALARHESRGLHQLQDYPDTDVQLTGKNTILLPERGRVMSVKEVRMEALVKKHHQ